MKLRHYLFLLLLIAALISSCQEQGTAVEYREDELIAGDAVYEIKRSCKYDNGNFCEEQCCSSDLVCNGKKAYQTCDLSTGKWTGEYNEDASCSIKCDELMDMGEYEKIKTAELEELKKNTQCSVGWKCVETEYRGYQQGDCSITEIEFCDYGCKSGRCNPRSICEPDEIVCQGRSAMQCSEDLSKWVLVEECEDDCRNGLCIFENKTKGLNLTNLTEITESEEQQGDQPADGCIIVINFHYKADGDERKKENWNDEYFVLKNTCPYSINTGSWTANDDEQKHIYMFSDFNFESNAEVTIRSGDGTDSSTELYWANGIYSGKSGAIWNNDGDNLTLKDSTGQVVLTYTYP